MKKVWKLCLLIVVTAIIGVGCEAIHDVDVSTLIITKNKEVVQVLIEEFDEYSYSVEAFEDMVLEELDEYHTTEEYDRITLDELLVENESVKLKMTYSSNIDYMEFNDILLFVGSIDEAIEKEYIQKGTKLIGVENQDSYTREQLQELEERESLTVVVVDEVIGIRVPKSIQYYSQGAILKGDTDISGDESMSQTIVIY